MFTLGEASWQDFPMVGCRERCDLDAGIVSTDGYMYLAVGDTEARIMAFDLNMENFTSIRLPPSIPSRRGSWRLTEVHGRIGIAFTHESQMLAKIEVWVMEGMPEQFKWNCWYILRVNLGYWWWHHYQQLAWPHFAHGGNHVLTQDHNNFLFRHVPSGDTRKARHGVVETSEKNHGRMICDTAPFGGTYVARVPSFTLRQRSRWVSTNVGDL
jgi:hypothetical protein